MTVCSDLDPGGNVAYYGFGPGGVQKVIQGLV